ncbi:MAG: hypothetical protein U0176_26535 [Bacteroidia bacterium]
MAIGTSIKPYDERTSCRNLGSSPWSGRDADRARQSVVIPGPYFEEPLMAEAVEALNLLHKVLKGQGVELVVIVPALAECGSSWRPSRAPTEPAPADTCFFDGKHLRESCVNAYSYEIATRFNAYRATKRHPSPCDSLR